MNKNPFLHQNLELKNELIDYARRLMFKANNTETTDDDIAALIAAGLLYANLVDYLAANLLQGLEYMTKVSTREFMNCTIVYRSESQLNITLEKTIRGLKKYDFPSRETILRLLDQVRKHRNKLAHEIFKTPNIEEIGEAARSLSVDAEEIVSEINALYRSMPPKTIMDSTSKDEKG